MASASCSSSSDTYSYIIVSFEFKLNISTRYNISMHSAKLIIGSHKSDFPPGGLTVLLENLGGGNGYTFVHEASLHYDAAFLQSLHTAHVPLHVDLVRVEYQAFYEHLG